MALTTESNRHWTLTREAVKSAPELTDDLLISRNYEIELYNHYNHEGYWAEELAKH